MSLTQPTLNGIPFARDSVQVNVIPDTSGVTGAASWSDGFPPETMIPLTSGGIPPSGQDFNGILSFLSQHQVWLNAGGQYQFNAALATATGGYAVGSIVIADDFLTSYINTVTGNTSNPNSGGAGWDVWVERGHTNGWVNVKQFGAVPDALLDPAGGNYAENPSATDNTAAFQLALIYSATNRLNLYVPSGFYYCAGTMYPQTLGLGPRRGQRIFSDACELGAIIGAQGVDMFDLIDTVQGSITFENIGLWARQRTPTTPYTVNDTSTAIKNTKMSSDPDDPEHVPAPIGNMRLRLKEVLFRFFQTAVDASVGSWLTQIEDSEFIGCRYGMKLKDSYGVVIKKNNFICGTAIYSPTSALIQCEIADNHFDIGTFTEVLDVEISHMEGDVKVIDVPRVLRPYNTVDIATQGLDWNNNYMELYGQVHPEHIVLNLHSQISDNSSFRETYINVGSAECILRKINTNVAISHAQELSFEKTTIIASNPTTLESWWTFDPSLTYFFYAYDDIIKNISSNDNPLIPINQEHLRLLGTLNFDPNIGVQQFDLSAVTLTANNSYIGNTKMITAGGKLNLKAGAYEITVTPQSLQTSTVGKTIDLEINGPSGACRAHLFDGVRSSGLSAQLVTYITGATLAGTDRQIDLICTGFSGAANIDLLCVIEVRMISSQRLLF